MKKKKKISKQQCVKVLTLAPPFFDVVSIKSIIRVREPKQTLPGCPIYTQFIHTYHRYIQVAQVLYIYDGGFCANVFVLLPGCWHWLTTCSEFLKSSYPCYNVCIRTLSYRTHCSWISFIYVCVYLVKFQSRFSNRAIFRTYAPHTTSLVKIFKSSNGRAL